MQDKAIAQDKGWSIVIPEWNDPRVLIVCYFAIFLSYAIMFPGFARSPLQLLTSFSTCFLLDATLTYYRTGRIAFPMSGVVTSAGIFLLTDSEGIFFYFLNAVISISGKHFFRLGDRHLFNPNNFGIVILLLAFPDFVTVAPYRWGGSFLITMFLFALGVTICLKAGRIFVATSYYVAFVAGAYLRSIALGAPFDILLVPITGAGMQLFIFFMITDPKTSPGMRSRQILFGVAVALLDNLFRFYEIRQAPFFALPFITFAYALYAYYRPETGVRGPWRMRVLSRST